VYLDGRVSGSAASGEGDEGTGSIQSTLLWLFPWLVEEESHLLEQRRNNLHPTSNIKHMTSEIQHQT